MSPWKPRALDPESPRRGRQEQHRVSAPSQPAFCASMIIRFLSPLTGNAVKHFVVRSSAFMRSSSPAGRLKAELRTTERPFLAAQKYFTALPNGAFSCIELPIPGAYAPGYSLSPATRAAPPAAENRAYVFNLVPFALASVEERKRVYHYKFLLNQITTLPIALFGFFFGLGVGIRFFRRLWFRFRYGCLVRLR